jgi:hypothetical protein
MTTGYHYPMLSDHRMTVSPWLQKLFVRVLHARYIILMVFGALTAAGIYGASRIPTDSSIDRLIVAGDPVVKATAEFDKVFPEGEQALIMLESPDPLSAAALQSADQLERALNKIPNVQAHSLLTVFFRASPPERIGDGDAAKLRTFANGTTLFRRSGLMGDRYLGIGLDLRVNSPAERDRALDAIDAVVLPIEVSGHPLTAVRRVARHGWMHGWRNKPAHRRASSCRSLASFS